MATVEMTFTPLPAHVRTARLVATTVARRSGVTEALLDEVRLAVGEACSHAVEVHQAYCPEEPVRVELTGAGGRFEVVVTNTASGASEEAAAWLAAPLPADGALTGAIADDVTADSDFGGLPPAMRHELGLAVISGLADDVQVARNGNGVSIRMSWPATGPTAPG
jgi:serine/threonine-protein kinase RsbW